MRIPLSALKLLKKKKTNFKEQVSNFLTNVTKSKFSMLGFGGHLASLASTQAVHFFCEPHTSSKYYLKGVSLVSKLVPATADMVTVFKTPLASGSKKEKLIAGLYGIGVLAINLGAPFRPFK